MHVEPVDERTSAWVDHRPRFRVYLFEGDGEPGGSLDPSTYDVTGAEALEVISWAEEQAGDHGLYAVALVGDRGGRKGLTWLQGIDANAAPGDLRHEVLRTAMLARRGRRSVTR
ncbi:MAG: hypothetical protein WAV00_05230 [Nocardioides sp.]